MPPNKLLAEALRAVKELQDKSRAIPSAPLNRAYREILIRNGFLKPVIKGWYIVSDPGAPGSSTAWYVSMLDFVGDYCTSRFGEEWHASPGDSLQSHTGSTIIPKQLTIHNNVSNQRLDLLHDTSLMFYSRLLVGRENIKQISHMQVMDLPATLVHLPPNYFVNHSRDVSLALTQIREPSAILRILLSESKPVVAGRLVGAFEANGQGEIAREILETMRAAGHDIRPGDPFKSPLVGFHYERNESPYVIRMRSMWADMRGDVIDVFGAAPASVGDTNEVMQDIEENYKRDAYNSLSIEGYRVTEELIERVSRGDWNPELNTEDEKSRDAMAAKGYWLAHNDVKDSVKKMLKNGRPGNVFREDLGTWYRSLFMPSVQAGILKPENLAGYRSHQVFIRNANHVPPQPDAVRDMMPIFFELLEQEEHPAVRAVLGHFMFVYIHPYMDGNGRIGRFLMNSQLVSGGYHWTVITMANREKYMAALNAASGERDIRPFAMHVQSEMEASFRNPEDGETPRWAFKP